jgi:hypothetical protein
MENGGSFDRASQYADYSKMVGHAVGGSPAHKADA